MGFLRLDRQRDDAVLAVYSGELRFDLLIGLQDHPRILDSVTCHLGGSQLPHEAVDELDHRHLRIDFLDDAFDDAAFGMLGNE